MRRALHDQFAGVITSVLPELLDGLRTELVDVMAQLRDADGSIGGLDIADPSAVAAGSSKQRTALLSLDELSKRYNKLRKGQRDALQASSVSPPGTHSLSGSHGWPQVFESGVHEFSDPGQYGLPPGHLQRVARFRGLAQRPDVWLPTVEQMRDVYRQRAVPAGHGVVHWDDEYLYPNAHEGSTAS